MGECTYYLAGRFESAEQAEATKPQLAAICKTLAEFQTAWQHIRGETETRTCAERREILKKQFPTLATMIDAVPCTTMQQYGRDDESMNCLAGAIPDMNDDPEVWTEDTELRMYCDNVWHLGSWDALANWLRALPGCTEAGWISEEDIDPHPFAQIFGE